MNDAGGDDGSILAMVKKTNINTNIIRRLFTKNKSEHQIIAEAQELQELFSKIYHYTNFLTYVSYLLERELKFVYFTPFADFRGRLYYRSEASIQSLWCFRFIYYYKKTLEQSNNIYPLYPFERDFLNTSLPNCRNPASIEFILAIGMIFKTEKINTSTASFSLLDILQLGLKYYEKYKNLDLITESQNFDLRDLAELYYYIHAFSQEQDGVSRGYYIWKDTTASVIQHGGKLLGYKSTALKYLNLNNDIIAYDTYQVVINELKLRLQGNVNIPANVINSLNRKILKQLIMTCEYQVSWQTAQRRFSYLVNTLAKKDTDKASLANPDLFKNIFHLLKSGLVAELFFQKNNHDWYQENAELETTLGDLTLNNRYFKPVYATLYFDKKNVEQRERATMKVLIPSWESADDKDLDAAKTRQAAYVNSVHAYDALYLRTICSYAKSHGIELAAIHDGFGVAYYNSKWLIGAANQAFWLVKDPANPFSTTIVI